MIRGMMSDKHKQAIREGRALAKLQKVSNPFLASTKTKVFDKPKLVYTGKETNAFDFIPKIRSSFRKQNNFIASPKIVKEITDPKIWENVGLVLRILEKYCVLEKVEKIGKEKPVKKEKTRSTSYHMTEEHKLKLKLAREAKKRL